MERFIAGIVRAHNEQFQNGIKILLERRRSWNRAADEAVAYFEKVKAECEAQKLFEAIYIVDSRKYENTKYYLPHLSLYFGQHPLGYHEFNSRKLAVEGGCTLTIAQTVLGNVVATYYPFESALLNLHEKRIIAATYHAPWELTDLALDSLINDFFSYAQVSSVYGSPSVYDRMRVRCMRLRHWWLHFRVTKALTRLIYKLTVEGLKKATSGGT